MKKKNCAKRWIHCLALAALFFLQFSCTTKPKNLDDLYGTWDLISRTILATPQGIIIDNYRSPGFKDHRLTFEEGGTLIYFFEIADSSQTKTGKWEAEGSNLISLKVDNTTHFGTFKVKDDLLTIERTMAWDYNFIIFDYNYDGYPESYTVIQEFERMD